MFKQQLKPLLFVLLIVLLASCQDTKPVKPEWPEITQTSKPWTRWWWMGSSVTPSGISANMEKYAEAGIGGLEITPIYGVKGYEDQFVDYLSPQWMEYLTHSLDEAKRLDLGIDMATGTGWPFGGPWIGKENACKYMTHKVYELNGGERLNEPVTYMQKEIVGALGAYKEMDYRVRHKIDLSALKQPISANDNLQAKALTQIRFKEPLPLQTLVAYSDNGDTIDLTNKVDANGNLNWIAPSGKWKLYAVFQGWHGKMVERAAPGGEGNVIDHFSEDALKKYLSHLDREFSSTDISYLRAFFNDSYEVDDANGQSNWTPDLFDAFEANRGYDLRQHLPALFGDDSGEQNARVLSDYRHTIDELLLEQFTQQWQNWASSKNKIVRNQAHGSPANILDLYAASDIPETEGNEIMRFKFATSAAHVTGKQLVSAEAATWLNEHFMASWSDVKYAVDKFFLAGVNHIFYHGTNYSPPEEEWPGWLFYAAVHFNPANPQWKDFSTLNQYITRTQSFLQSGKPDNDLLLYFPIFDRYSTQEEALLQHFDGMEGLEGTSFQTTAEWLHENGYTFDFISDRQIEKLKSNNGKLISDSAHYQTIIVPETQYMPVSTLERLTTLAEAGNTIIFLNDLPADAPGLGNLEERQTQLQSLKDQLKFEKVQDHEAANLGKGKIILGDNITQMLAETDVRQETMVQQGLQFVRRKDEDGPYYFIANESDENFEGWISLKTNANSAAIFNPMTEQMGKAPVKENEDGTIQVYLHLDVRESCIVKTYQNNVTGDEYPHFDRSADPITLNGSWEVSFVEGGPTIPTDTTIQEVMDWTQFDNENAKSFSGTTKYSLQFPRPENTSDTWEIDLGEVYETARVMLNGQEIGTVIGPEYKVTFDNDLLKDNNQLDVYVSNLMANRIAFMDKNNVPWKKFYNINFPARLAENRDENGLFDASHWAPLPSGLEGPVMLTPLEVKVLDGD